MATTQLNLLDLVARSSSDTVAGLIELVTTSAPEMQVLPVIPRAGTTYKVTRRSLLPGSGFRNVNEGVAKTASTYTQQVVSMNFLDVQLEVDDAIVRGDTGEIGDLLLQEAEAGLRSAVITVGEQVWYGTSADAKGFAGVQSQLTTAFEVTAGGTTNTTSAYLLYCGADGIHLPVGMDGEIKMGDWTTQQVRDGSSNPYMAHVNSISGYIGLQVIPSTAYRIRGIEQGNNSRWLTDARGAELLALVPSRYRIPQTTPGGTGLRWFINRSAAYTLQASRSAVGQTAFAAGAFAPLPTEIQGIPVTITDSIVSTETAA